MSMPEPDVSELQSKISCFNSAFNEQIWKFEIPDIQRNYVWRQHLASDLWFHLTEELDRILKVQTHDADYTDWYYLGALVIWKPKGRNRFIVDGQQRMTTYTLLVCAIRDYLDWIIQERKLLTEKFQQWNDWNEELKNILKDIEEINLDDHTATEFDENDKYIGGEFIRDVDGEQEFWDPIWTEERLSKSIMYANDFTQIYNVENWISEDSIPEGGFEQYEIEDEHKVSFPPPPQPGDHDFTYRPGQGGSIKGLADRINRYLIFKEDVTDDHKLKPRLVLKDNDGERLKCIQNRIDGIVTVEESRARTGTPGSIKRLGIERSSRAIGTSALYNNYDLLVDLVMERFEDFGTRYYPIGGQADDDTERLEGNYSLVHHTDEQLSEAMEWFEKLERFLREHVQVTITTFSDIAKAYQAFVKINSQSQPLTLTDVIRALILSKLYGTIYYDGAKTQLNLMADLDKLPKEKYIRAHWISENSLKRTETEIGLLLSEEFTNMDNPGLLDYSTRVGAMATVYMNYYSPELMEEDPEQNYTAQRYCFIKAGPRQHLPMMLAVYSREWTIDQRIELHKIYESVYIYHFLTGGSPSKAEAIFAECCKHINSKNDEGEWVNSYDDAKSLIIQDFRKLFVGVTRESIIEKLTQIKLNQQQAHFLLRGIEHHLHATKLEEVFEQINLGLEVQYAVRDVVRIKSPDKVHLEHIMPQKIENVTYWTDQFTEQTHEENLWKLGNLTLLNAKLNASIQNSGFVDKKEVYAPPTTAEENGGEVDEGDEEELTYSNILMTNELLTYEEWNAEAITQRGKKLSEYILLCWNCFEFPSRTVEDGEESTESEGEEETTEAAEDNAPIENDESETNEPAREFNDSNEGAELGE